MVAAVHGEAGDCGAARGGAEQSSLPGESCLHLRIPNHLAEERRGQTRRRRDRARGKGTVKGNAESSDVRAAVAKRARPGQRGVGTAARPGAYRAGVARPEPWRGARRAARGRWRSRAERGRQSQAGSGWGEGGRSGVRWDPSEGRAGPSGAAWGGGRCRSRGPPGDRAAAALARTLALNSAAASTLFSDMVPVPGPGPGLAGGRGPGAETEEPWTAEGGRGRNLAR